MSKSLKDYTNEEIIAVLDHNESIDVFVLTCVCSEILRRMNDIQPLFPKHEEF
jgi:hypothetical protein